MATLGETENDGLAPPPLKKRATRRGLARSLATQISSDETSAVSSVDVYSNCVERHASLTDIQPARVPLHLIHDSIQESEEKTASGKQPETASVDVDDTEDIIELENIQSDKIPGASGDNYRSPSPPSAVISQPRQKRMKKGIKKALETLGMAKGELQLSNWVSSLPLVNDDSPDHKTYTQVVRIRHMQNIHRFSMAKTDMFYNLLTHMAELLGKVTDHIGLYLQDSRLKPTDTPLSINLHLADIIDCHVLVPTVEGGQCDKQVRSEDAARVLMQCPSSRDNVHIVVKKYLPFKDMMEEYGRLRGKPLDTFRFKLDGELLSPDKLPTDVDLDDGDTIDVMEIR